MIRTNTYIIDVIEPVSSVQSKFSRVILVNPKGFLEIGNNSTPNALLQAGMKLLLGKKFAKAVQKSVKQRLAQEHFVDELDSIKTLHRNKKSGVSN